MKKRLLSTQSEVQYIYKVNSVYLNPRALLCKLEQDRAAWCKRTRAERSQPLPNVLSGLIGARQKCAHSAAFWHLPIATAPQLRMPLREAGSVNEEVVSLRSNLLTQCLVYHLKQVGG
jgi:hypothetical protein